MAGYYFNYVAARATEPDDTILVAQLRGTDTTIGYHHEPGTPNYVVKKGSPWTVAQQNTISGVSEISPASSARLTTQEQVDRLSMLLRAILLFVVDELNVIRAATLPRPLPLITPEQALAAVKAKAGTL